MALSTSAAIAIGCSATALVVAIVVVVVVVALATPPIDAELPAGAVVLVPISMVTSFQSKCPIGFTYVGDTPNGNSMCAENAAATAQQQRLLSTEFAQDRAEKLSSEELSCKPTAAKNYIVVPKDAGSKAEWQDKCQKEVPELRFDHPCPFYGHELVDGKCLGPQKKLPAPAAGVADDRPTPYNYGKCNGKPLDTVGLPDDVVNRVQEVCGIDAEMVKRDPKPLPVFAVEARKLLEAERKVLASARADADKRAALLVDAERAVEALKAAAKARAAFLNNVRLRPTSAINQEIAAKIRKSPNPLEAADAEMAAALESSK